MDGDRTAEARENAALSPTPPARSNRRNRLIGAALLVMAGGLGGTSAKADPAEVVNIRFGHYPDRVRVVLDLKSPVPYRTEGSSDGRTVTVVLPPVKWTPPVKRALAKMEPLRDYQFHPGPRPNESRLELIALQPLRVVATQAFLPDSEHPTHRIMVDLTPHPGGVKAPPPALVATAPAPSPAAAAAPTRPPVAAPAAALPEPIKSTAAVGLPKAPPAVTAEQALERGAHAIMDHPDYPDYAQAMRWFRKSAGLGNSQAAFNLGELYRTGKGVPLDLAAAAGWYEKSSRAGIAPAQFFLGVLLYNGTGVTQDRTKARDLLTLAAKQGYAPASQALDEIRKMESAPAQ